ncbi:alpha/beta fold hydrolase [Roseitalea porphyridii]|uniref:Alpha/beta hydrolase n=1 Tax=Roseitalea porphyridii TaxID=1852022 RepID=A0A4P6V0R6_9HYPH|nr:alpha/beta hydrolase [Roseitalea porphyridii]QBK30219.1 alpha/beta hydrolase [Roseitalea porphyridii]
MPADFDNGESIFVSARDGLRLHVRAFGPRHGNRMPLICLPGLSRNSRDFLGLAAHFANHPKAPRRVYAMDFRGRGLSGYDANWRNYNVMTEAEDVLSVLAALDIDRAVFVGTSRGGLVTMLLTAMRPGAIGAAILNDIGPAIEGAGLIQIRLYLKQLPQPHGWAEAVETQKVVMARAFTSLTEDDWRFEAHARFREIDGAIRPDHDPALVRTLTAIDPGDRLPTVWPQFAGLRSVPTLLLRGENSTLLSEETTGRMAAIHPALTRVDIAGQGHAPMLHTPQPLAAIEAFVGRLR